MLACCSVILDFAIHAFSFALRTGRALLLIMPRYSLVRCATGVGTVLLLCVSWCELEGGSGQTGGGASRIVFWLLPVQPFKVQPLPATPLNDPAFEGPSLWRPSL